MSVYDIYHMYMINTQNKHHHDKEKGYTINSFIHLATVFHVTAT